MGARASGRAQAGRRGVSELDRLSVLVHELRSPVAALRAIEETLRAVGDEIPGSERRRLIELAVAAGRDIQRLLVDPDLFSIDPADVDLVALLVSFAGPRVDVEVEEGLAARADPV